MSIDQTETLAYVVGVALGDGNLSNPNGRATRLRITCDAKYPRIMEDISTALRAIFPKNKVSRIPKGTGAFDISVYSNRLDLLMPWQAGKGPKARQQARVPEWIRDDARYSRACLRGLIQTDGCIYIDRGYPMVNFVNTTYLLAKDAHDMLVMLGYHPNFIRFPLDSRHSKYTVRIARKAEAIHVVEDLGLYKE